MKLLRLLSINQRLWALLLLAIVGIATISILDLLHLRNTLMEEKTLYTKNVVETAYSVITTQHERFRQGNAPEDEAKAAALATIRDMRYDGSNYFWINDMQSRMVMHPIKPALDGTDVSGMKDSNGTQIFVAFVNTVRENGAGTVPYLWPKPGQDKPVAKISYVKGFAPWGWVIGSGIYVDDVEAQFWSQARSLGIMVTLIAIPLLLLSYWIANSIIQPLQRTTAAMQNIAEGDGDLTLRMQVEGNDCVARLAKAFNSFAESIQNTVREVSQVGHQLAASASTLTAGATRSRDDVNTQKTEMHQTATAVTEMTATVFDIAKSAESTAAYVKQADKDARYGQGVVQTTTRSVEAVSSSLDSTSGVVNQLEAESLAIGSVLDVIRSIAEQTNLLALNAAIEAARAGDQGRGFAVVADEVRTLAIRTQESTQQIRDMIERLQEGSRNAVISITQSKETTAKTVETAQNAAATFNKITDAIAAISQMTAQVATAAEEQSAAAGEIDRSTVHIASLAESAAATADQVAEASEELTALSNQVHHLLRRFKV